MWAKEGARGTREEVQGGEYTQRSLCRACRCLWRVESMRLLAHNLAILGMGKTSRWSVTCRISYLPHERISLSATCRI